MISKSLTLALVVFSVSSAALANPGRWDLSCSSPKGSGTALKIRLEKYNAGVSGDAADSGYPSKASVVRNGISHVEEDQDGALSDLSIVAVPLKGIVNASLSHGAINILIRSEAETVTKSADSDEYNGAIHFKANSMGFTNDPVNGMQSLDSKPSLDCDLTYTSGSAD